jgi:hypothetical protein
LRFAGILQITIHQTPKALDRRIGGFSRKPGFVGIAPFFPLWLNQTIWKQPFRLSTMPGDGHGVAQRYFYDEGL